MSRISTTPRSLRAKAGTRKDLGIYVRSSWEANYCRYLDLLIKMKIVETWDYEPVTFWFKGIKRGCVSYKPDFRVKFAKDKDSEFHEIKGRETAQDRTKWRRMKKYHPEIKLIIIGAKEYRAIKAQWATAIHNWE